MDQGPQQSSDVALHRLYKNGFGEPIDGVGQGQKAPGVSGGMRPYQLCLKIATDRAHAN